MDAEEDVEDFGSPRHSAHAACGVSPAVSSPEGIAAGEYVSWFACGYGGAASHKPYLPLPRRGTWSWDGGCLAPGSSHT